MTTETIKTVLHQFVNTATDDQLQDMYRYIETIDQDAELDILHKRAEKYAKGQGNYLHCRRSPQLYTQHPGEQKGKIKGSRNHANH